MSDLLNNLFSLDGKVVIVTGASRGIGRALAEGFAEVGASVHALARSDRHVANLVEDVAYHSCDVLDNARFTEICHDISASEGRIDALVNAAGISMSPGSEGDIEDFDRILDINLKAAYRCCLAASEFMCGSEAPAIVNITSINSLVGFPGNPGYVASKGGLRMLTKALAIDLGERNIRVNAIAPGYILTGMTRKSHDDPEMHEQRLRHMIIPRWGKPEDIVGTAIFLLSPASSYITGQDFVVDGGWTAKGLT